MRALLRFLRLSNEIRIRGRGEIGHRGGGEWVTDIGRRGWVWLFDFLGSCGVVRRRRLSQYTIVLLRSCRVEDAAGERAEVASKRKSAFVALGIHDMQELDLLVIKIEK